MTVLRAILDEVECIRYYLNESDKTENIDGRIALLDTENLSLGQFEVQVKSLTANSKVYQCSTKFVSYSCNNGLPFILICVDVKNKRAYWRLISKNMHEFNQEHDSFQIAFTDAHDRLDRKRNYVTEWFNIVHGHVALPSEYSDVQSVLNEDLLLSHMTAPQIQGFQSFIDSINGPLDSDLRFLKRRFFPTLWKFGVCCYDISENGVCYKLYTIRKGINAPLVVSSRESASSWNPFDSNTERRLKVKAIRLTMATPFFSNPQKRGAGILREFANQAIEHRIFGIAGNTAIAESVYSFLERHGNLISIIPGDNFDVIELSNAFDALILERMATYTQNYEPSGNAQTTIVPNRLAKTFPSYIAVESNDDDDDHVFIVDDALYEAGKVAKALKYLTSRRISSIRRPYRQNSQLPSVPLDVGVAENLVENLSIVLKSIYSDYHAFLENNEMAHLGSYRFDPTRAAIFVYGKTGLASSHQKLNLDLFTVHNADMILPAVSIVNNAECKYSMLQQGATLTIGKNSHEVLTLEQNIFFEQLNSNTPLIDMIYELLRSDMNRLFENIVKKEPS